MKDRDDEVLKLLRQIFERLESIEGILELIRQDLKDLRKIIRSTEELRVGRRSRDKERYSLKDVIDKMIYLETKDIKAKELLRRLINKGELITLRDDVLNLEVVTTPKVIRNIIKKLPVQVSEVDKILSEREYQLLKVLNRLGYVLIKDNQYVATDLVKELIEK